MPIPQKGMFSLLIVYIDTNYFLLTGQIEHKNPHCNGGYNGGFLCSLSFRVI